MNFLVVTHHTKIVLRNLKDKKLIYAIAPHAVVAEVVAVVVQAAVAEALEAVAEGHKVAKSYTCQVIYLPGVI